MPAKAQNAGSIPEVGQSPGEGMATHSSTLTWKIPWTEEPGVTKLSDRTLATKQQPELRT